MKVVIIGAGGHARVVYEVLRYDKNVEVVAFVDNVTRGADEEIMGVPMVGDHSVIPALIRDGVKGAIVGIGDNTIRAGYFVQLKAMGVELIKAIHPTAHNSTYAGVEIEAAYQPLRYIRFDAAFSQGFWSYTDNVSGSYIPDFSDPDSTKTYDYFIKDLKVGDAPQTQLALSFTLFFPEGLQTQLVWRYYDNYYADIDPFSRTNEQEVIDNGRSPAGMESSFI